MPLHFFLIIAFASFIACMLALRFSTWISTDPLGWKVRYIIFAFLLSVFTPTAILILIVAVSYVLTDLVMFLTSLKAGGRFKRLLNYEFFKRD